MIGGMLRVLVIGLVLLVAVMFMLPRMAERAPRPETATVIDEPRALPEFELADTAGRAFTPADLEGGFHLLFFGFTNCPDICPVTLQVLANIKPRLEQRFGEDAPEVVFVSVDPARDTPERIDAYLENFDSAFTGVTGSDEALAPLIDTLGVAVRKHESQDRSYNVTHSGHVFVIGPDARWRAVFRPSTEADVLVSDYARIHEAVARGIPFAQPAR